MAIDGNNSPEEIITNAMLNDADEKRERIDHLSEEQRQAIKGIAGAAQEMLDEYQAFLHPTIEQVINLDDRLAMLRHEFVLNSNQ